METVGEQRSFPGPWTNLLGVPVPEFRAIDVEYDEAEDVVIRIRPKSSPLPRRRSGDLSDGDSEPETPPSRSRRVSFADAQGLSLVRVKEFNKWDIPNLPSFALLDNETKDPEEFCVSAPFPLPLPSEEVATRVQERKLGLENVEFIPGTSTLRGVIRVLNLSFDKTVYVRTTLDAWTSHFDLLAEYVPGSSDGVTDCFAFKLTLVPPFEEEHGATVEFCLRYETSVGTFWDNNRDKNYVLFCHQKAKENKEEVDKEQHVPVCKKSCLKTSSKIFATVEHDSSLEISLGISTQEAIPAQQSSESLEEQRQKLLVENSRNSKQRNRRRAARLARMKDRFSQRDGKPGNKEHEEPLIDTTATTQEEKTHSTETLLQCLPVKADKYIPPEPITDPLPTSSNTDVQCETSTVQSDTSHSDSGKSESTESLQHQRPSETSENGGGKLTAEIQNHSNSRDYDFDMSDTSHTADTSYRTVSSAERIEGSVNQAAGFTFGTVVAPLYHQVVGSVGGESRNLADGGNPVRGQLNKGTPSFYTAQTCLHTERQKTSENVTTIQCVKPAAITSGLGNENQESHQEFVWSKDHLKWYLNTSLKYPLSDTVEAATMSVSPDDSSEEIPGAPVNTVDSHQQLLSENVMEPLATANVSNAEEPKIHSIPRESSHLQGEDQDDILFLTNDVENKALVQAQDETQLQHHKDKHSQIKTVPDSKENADAACIQTLSSQPHVSQVSDHLTTTDEPVDHEHIHESKDAEDIHATATVRTPYCEQETQMVNADDCNSDCRDDSATASTENSTTCNLSLIETSEGQDLMDIALNSSRLLKMETNKINEVTDDSGEEKTKKSLEDVESEEMDPSTCHLHTDRIVSEITDKITVEYNANIIPEKTEPSPGTDVVTKLTEVKVETEEKNWEMMVEEEEVDGLIEDEGSEKTGFRPENAMEALTKEKVKEKQALPQERLFENVELDVTEEERQQIQEETIEEITIAEIRPEEFGDADTEENVKEEETMAEQCIVGEKGRIREEEWTGEVSVEEDVPRMQEEDFLWNAGAEEETEAKEKEREANEGVETKEKEGEANEGEEPIEKEGEVNEGEEAIEKEGEVNEGEEAIEKEGEASEGEEPIEKEGEANEGEEAIEKEGEANDPEETEQEEGEANKGEEAKQMTANREHMEEVITEEGDREFVVGKRGEATALDQRLSTPIDKVIEGDTTEHTCGEDETNIHTEGYNQSVSVPTGLAKAACQPESGGRDVPAAPDTASRDVTEGPDSDRTDSEDGASSSDSQSDEDDEVELYMHCLRVAHNQSLRPGTLNYSKEKSLSAGRRPSIGRNRSLSMPSISESVDEEQPSGSLQHHTEDAEREEATPAATPLPTTGGLERANNRVVWWRETFSCSNISKAFLYTCMIMFFFFVAYHYNFLAYFALYLLSVFWLYGQGEKQPVKKQQNMLDKKC